MSKAIVTQNDDAPQGLIKQVCALAAAHQVGYASGDPDQPWKYKKAVEGPPPQDVFDAHCNGDAPFRLLAHPVGEQQEPGQLVLVDGDNKLKYKTKIGSTFLNNQQLDNRIEEIEAVLDAAGYSPLWCQSTSGLGRHLWLKFKEPVGLQQIKQHILDLLKDKLNLTKGDKGIGAGQVEVLLNATAPGFDDHVISEPPGGWQYSKPPKHSNVIKFKPPKQATLNKQNLPPLEEIAEALEFIDADDRELWIKTGHGMKNCYGEDGFEVWDSWSETSASTSPEKPKSSGEGSQFLTMSGSERSSTTQRRADTSRNTRQSLSTTNRSKPS